MTKYRPVFLTFGVGLLAAFALAGLHVLTPQQAGASLVGLCLSAYYWCKTNA